MKQSTVSTILIASIILVATLAAAYSAGSGINEDQMISYQAGLRET